MKEQEFLFLGLLNEGPKHGYQLKKQIREASSNFSGLKTFSIYYPLQKMLKNGLVTQSKVKEGKRPEKYVYKITARGNKEFKKLLKENILTVERPYFSLDLSLYFLPFLSQATGARYLKIRIKLLGRLRKILDKFKKEISSKSPLRSAVIIEHNQELLNAEINFLTRLLLR